MSVPVWIAFCLSVVVIGGMVIGFGRLANDGEDSSKRRLREAKKAQKEPRLWCTDFYMGKVTITQS